MLLLTTRRRLIFAFVRYCWCSASAEVLGNPSRNEESHRVLRQIGESGSLDEAWAAIESLENPPAALLFDSITAFAQIGDSRSAFHLFRRILLQGVPPSSHILVPLLKLCSTAVFLAVGRTIHAMVAERGLDREIFVGNTIITMYRKCGTMADAIDYFRAMPQRNTISWNAIVTAFAENGDREEAMDSFHRMQHEGFLPNRVTFLAMLGSLSGKNALIQATRLHDLLLASGIAVEPSVANAILNACSKNGGLIAARRAFDRTLHRDIITWTTMIDAYSESGISSAAFQLFRLMLHDGHLVPNKITFVALLKGCSILPEARFLDAIIRESGYESNSIIANNLIKAFSRCGSPDHARAAFERVISKDTILWTGLITAYAEHGLHDEALRLYALMESEGLAPDRITYTTILDVCARSTAIAEGKLVHAAIAKSGIELDTALENSILNMYGKCGKMAETREFFASIRHPDLLSWSIYISSHAHHGHGRRALELFREMVHAGVEADYSAFVNILSACRHAGLVSEGCEIFHRMVADCGFAARSEQYCCLVDLLGRSGRLDLAEEVLRGMPFRPGQVMWKAFLSACKQQGDLARAKLAADKVLEIDPGSTSAFVVLSNTLKEEPGGVTQEQEMACTVVEESLELEQS
ncbi:pentatricopeptide repeat-containing protein At4g39530 [Selaginella moellendorffii]|nr:pentatricopeptide repeat-containing protein At4g39530 [Selaginella moellendorffii]|eukprot:XP_002977369.2 pentatricopeptide repeat-containing protein At4g39530 [Selaginella moellendorffii]